MGDSGSIRVDEEGDLLDRPIGDLRFAGGVRGLDIVYSCW
jgi:hypothetical protein